MASESSLPTIIEDKHKEKRDMRSAINYSLSNMKSTKGDAMTKASLDNLNANDIKDLSVKLDASSVMSKQDK